MVSRSSWASLQLSAFSASAPASSAADHSGSTSVWPAGKLQTFLMIGLLEIQEKKDVFEEDSSQQKQQSKSWTL